MTCISRPTIYANDPHAAPFSAHLLPCGWPPAWRSLAPPSRAIASPRATCSRCSCFFLRSRRRRDRLFAHPRCAALFLLPGIHRLALQYNLDLPAESQACIERVMETLRPERVIDAMRKALDDPQAHIDILELSRFPVRTAISSSIAPICPWVRRPCVWRGVVRYAGGRKFGSGPASSSASRAIAWSLRKTSGGQAHSSLPGETGTGRSLSSSENRPAHARWRHRHNMRVPVKAGGVIAPGMVHAPKKWTAAMSCRSKCRAGPRY